MEEEAEYTIGGVRHVCTFSRADFRWGHGLDVKIYDEVGSLLNEVGFVCHPEHADYDRLQAMNTKELIAIASEQLSSGIHEDALRQARQHGLKLFFSFSRAGPPLRPAS